MISSSLKLLKGMATRYNVKENKHKNTVRINLPSCHSVFGIIGKALFVKPFTSLFLIVKPFQISKKEDLLYEYISPIRF